MDNGKSDEDIVDSRVNRAEVLVIIFMAAVLCYFILIWLDSCRHGNTNEFADPTDHGGATDTLFNIESQMVTSKHSIDVIMKVRAWIDNSHSIIDDEEMASSNANEAAAKAAGLQKNEESNDSTMDDLRKMSELRTEHVVDESTYRNKCVICLCSFECNQIVCESNHIDCVHIFHAECMKKWLAQNQACPMCRVAYLDAAT